MMILRWMDGTTVKRGEVMRLEFDYPKQVCVVVVKGDGVSLLSEPVGRMFSIPIDLLLDAYWVH